MAEATAIVAAERLAPRRRLRVLRKLARHRSFLVGGAIVLLLVFAALAAKVRAEEKGCLRYDLCRSVESPSTYVVVETYADQDALQVHSSTPHFLEFIGKMQEFAAGPPKIEMLHGAH